jgi:CheY-like chemotaxis protein
LWSDWQVDWHDRQVALRILVVDDHPAFRDLAQRLLIEGGYDVVGSAAGGGEAMRRVVDLQPDVVLLDVLLPDFDGFDAAQRLACLPQPPVVVLISSRTRSELAASLADAQVRGFLAKDELTLDSFDALLR